MSQLIVILCLSEVWLGFIIWQENYINYRPSSIGKDDNGLKRMNSIARAAESISDGDIFNVQIRRYRQWQLSQAASFLSCIIPYVLYFSGLNYQESSKYFHFSE